MGLWERMRAREEQGARAGVAVVGAGWVGQGLVHRFDRSPGMRPVLVVNRTARRGVQAYERAGHDRAEVVVSDDPDRLARAITDGLPAVTSRPEAVAELDEVEVVVEATGTLDHGARTILRALEAGKDVVSVNAEAEATVGHLLHRVAGENDRVYTFADGDQPGVLLRHMQFVEGMGFEVVAAVNCKRHLDLRQDPASSAPFAARDGTSPEITTAAGDGTKMQIENAVVANVKGLPPDCRGMHGVRTTLEHALADLLAVLARRGVVEYTLGGDFGAGVGVIGHAPEHDLVERSMRFYKMGPGPDYFFFRPYHLVHLEVPFTVAEVVLDRMGLGIPAGPPVADVVAVAKRDLVAGRQLDGIGGYTCYGLIDTVEGADGLLPIGLAHHARLLRPVPMDQPIARDAVELDEEAPVVRLRRRQEDLVGAET